jgi:hypothetical protein
MSRKKGKLPSGTWLERKMFLSKAYWNLGGAAPQLLTYFLSKRIRKNKKDRKGQNDDQWINLNNINVTYKELENLFTKVGDEKKSGITQPRITRAIDQLLEKGFIEIVHAGGAYKMDKTVYALVDKWITWVPGVVFSRRKKDVHRGFQDKNTKKGKVIELKTINA